MATREGDNIKHTQLLDNQYQNENAPNFDAPYPIENGMNVTKITLYKTKCCNKMCALLLISVFLLILMLSCGVFMYISMDNENGLIFLIVYGIFGLLPIILIARFLSILCQYNKTELYLDKKNDIIQIYESSLNNIYSNLNNINCTGCCSCNRKPKITTICRLSDFNVVELSNQQITSSSCCSSRSIPLDKVKLKFIDIYSKKENHYFIQQSGKYAEFTGCQYLNYIIHENKNEIQI